MKTFYSISAKRVAFGAAFIALFISALALQTGSVRGNAWKLFTANTTPLVGASLVLTAVHGSAHASTTTDASGNFHLSGSGGGLMPGTYRLTFTPAGGATTPPLQATINFNQLKGLLAGGKNASPGATGPISITSGQAMTLSLSFATGTISGTMTK